jgi:hypothetical protein
MPGVARPPTARARGMPERRTRDGSVMSPGNGKCYIFVDESIKTPPATDPVARSGDEEADLESSISRRRRRSFVAALMRRSGLRSSDEIVEISVEEQQRTHPIEIPDADLIVISWDSANGDGGRGSDQTLQFFATEGRSRICDVMSPDRGRGAVLFSECQTVQGLPVQAAYDAIFGTGEITVLSEPLKAEVRFGAQAYPAKFWGQTHPIIRGYEWPMREAFLANVPGGRRLQLFGPDSYPIPDDSNPVDTSPLIHYRRDSLWFGWFTSWKRGWVPLLIADLSCRAEAEYRGLAEVPAVLLAKRSGNGYLLASTLWVAAMPAVGRFIQRLQDPDWEAIMAYHRRVRLSQFLEDSIVTLAMLSMAVVLSAVVVYVTFNTSANNELRVAVVGSGLTVISIFNTWIIRGCRRIWSRPYGTGAVRWLLFPIRNYLHRRRLD